jgi:hypothetical protein
MKNASKKFRIIKEKEKIRQVSHWDLDYLPTESKKHFCAADSV